MYKKRGGFLSVVPSVGTVDSLFRHPFYFIYITSEALVAIPQQKKAKQIKKKVSFFSILVCLSLSF